jgi:hypothetical protein
MGAWGSHPDVATAPWLTTSILAGGVMALNGCAACLKQPQAIDRLAEVLPRLKPTLRDQER